MSDDTRAKTLLGVLERLREQGIQAHALSCHEDDDAAVKVICVPATLQGSLNALGESSRDQVVMVRVDTETVRKLDAWVETGALKSRSEAAALFMREGLGIRDGELAELEEALKDVAEAKRRLKKRAEVVLGGDS
jgi:Arc/MetJ-type ribon-helix-helix transcriptional regulator